MVGSPDRKHVSSSYIERPISTMRMLTRRFVRLPIAFSKKIENHIYAIALYFVYNHFAKIHSTLGVRPAIEAGLIKRIMSIEDIVNLAN
jgi:hypothetical protein